MTNHFIDFRNADVILNMGGNVAENHPVSFKWIQAAKDKGAIFIHVDPRFTRTSTKADIFVRLRSGTDIAFLGGMIKYILDNNLYDEFYVKNYTNASFMVNPKYTFGDGLFSGYDPDKRAYDASTWALEKDENGIPKKDFTLQDPRCVLQLLKSHYSRYTLEKVVEITGTPAADLEKVYKAYGSTGAPDKAGTSLYAMGWTQHTVGVQNIRAMSIIQLLLGNMGIAGGGVNALRGESNVQGSTDAGLLYHIWPGYLPTPQAHLTTLGDYNKTTPSSKDPRSINWWKNRPKYVASLLKSTFGDKATKDNEFAYAWMPRLDTGKDYSWLNLFDEMYKGAFTGFFAWGMNPACSSANAGKVRQAMGKLNWMVNVNVFDNETGSFWKGPGMDPKKIKTEVFLLPCAASMEKEGSISNSGRWMQWRYKAANPPGVAKPDGDIMYELFKKVRVLYEKEKGAFPDPILNLAWDYETNGHFDIHKVAKDINGYFEEDIPEHPVDKKPYKKGTLVPNFVYLLDDGRTSCGNWLYSQSYNEAGNMAARRKKTDPTGLGLYPEWSWCWPINRRIIYNRASVDLDGNPRNPKRPLLQWDAAAKKWIGDIPDNAVPPMGTTGAYPFIMKPDGVGSIFGPGLKDGPFPEHYEPLECPVEKNMMSSQRINPVVKIFEGGPDKFLTCDPKYPFVCSTYRVTEHWQTGVLTRWLPWLTEAEPQVFCEMSKELAKLREIKNGDRVVVETARGKLEAVAIVTSRVKPFNIAGNTVHQIGVPWHFGWIYPKDGGESANLLTPTVGDPNTMIPESKAFMANVRRIGRQPAKKTAKS
ncbi:MAG: formate dehydrogenase-N subunit alpha [Deltaproteobacteria bacterium RBG_13_52_11b]|nr:MAG: formate dehydrogenase-N subunit alpha [Deltaproteobacteria bacterium RBG_13_52_11b]